jgi:hypothetical protein
MELRPLIGPLSVEQSLLFAFNPVETRGNYMYHLLYQSVTLHFVFVGFV